MRGRDPGPSARDDSADRAGPGFFGPFLLLASLAFAFCAVRAVLDGRPLTTAVTDGWFRSLAGGSLAGAAVFARMASWRKGTEDESPGLARVSITAWIIAGAAFSLGTAVTALLTVSRFDHGLSELHDPMAWVAWALIAAFGAALGYAVGSFYLIFTTPLEQEVVGDEEAEGAAVGPGAGIDDEASGDAGADASGAGIGGRRWRWVAVVALLLGVTARFWADRIERDERERGMELAREVSSGAVLQRLMESAAAPGTPAATYADTVGQWLRTSRSRWYADPLTHRIDPPLGSAAFEVVFHRGRVESLRTVEEIRGDDTIPATEAAERLGLPPDHPVFHLEELMPKVPGTEP